jgi:hypothetical protein
VPAPWHNRLMRVHQYCRAGLVLAVALLTVAACTSAPPDRHTQVDQLTRQLRGMPGVLLAGRTFSANAARGPAFFEVDVDVDDDITGDQVAAVTAAYLDDLGTEDYAGYHAGLEVGRAGNVFVVDSGTGPVNNREQILSQARSWVALRQQFPGSNVKLRAAISHDGDAPGRPPATSGSVQLPDTADYTTVAAAVGTLASTFGDLIGGDWTISAGNQHPAEIRTSRRLPTDQEMDVWTTLNVDQSIPHAVVFTMNGAVTGPFWVSERLPTHDPDTAVRLAELHLPIVAGLPAPVLYSATDQFQGHIGFHGQATGPVTILIGACMKRDYRPSPAEQALIDEYQNCPH